MKTAGLWRIVCHCGQVYIGPKLCGLSHQGDDYKGVYPNNMNREDDLILRRSQEPIISFLREYRCPACHQCGSYAHSPWRTNVFSCLFPGLLPPYPISWFIVSTSLMTLALHTSPYLVSPVSSGNSFQVSYSCREGWLHGQTACFGEGIEGKGCISWDHKSVIIISFLTV